LAASITNGEKAIGIDIGGTKTAVAAVNRQGQIVARRVFATEAEQGFERALKRMAEAAEFVLTEAGWQRKDLCGIGIGCTGPVSAERGVINNPYTLHSWTNCEIVARLAAIFDRPAYLENDADAALVGECFAGAAQGASRVVMLTLGTGVGGSAVVNGQIYRGAGGEHPELGHIPINPSGAECYCGTRGCLESIASGTAIAAAGAAHGISTSSQVFARAASGDPAAVEILEQVRRALAMATWTILHTFMPEMILLGGGIIDDHYSVLASAVEEPIRRATMVPEGATRVAKAQLGNEAGIVGAAALALRRI
jgi:glucokinase